MTPPPKPRRKSRPGARAWITREDPVRTSRSYGGQATCIRVHRSKTHVDTYTLGQIAAGAGRSHAMISYAFKGQRSVSVDTLQAIAKHLRVTLDVLNAYIAAQRAAYLRARPTASPK